MASPYSVQLQCKPATPVLFRIALECALLASYVHHAAKLISIAITVKQQHAYLQVC